ncbi:hypothetical protein GCM10009801_37700 [Streptomyces albiaxialis]|uniref:DUF4026 domain-containing protein n=1 Tax=Streptomyces albiaxialis TaxID=329523 RepID=A0ABN2W0J4_9ACTN
MVMTRTRYASAPVVDGLPLLDEPGFWAAYLADLAGEFAPDAFGADPADAGDALERLDDPAAWPVFTVPLDGGGAILAHRNNGEEHSTTDHVLALPDRDTWLALAADDQDRVGPGLCWPELDAVRRPPESATAGVLDPHDRLLLLLPVLGDTAAPASREAVAAVAAALVARGAPGESVEALAQQLLGGHPMWGAAPWTYDADGASWICGGGLSPRGEPLGAFLSWRRHLVQHDYGMGALLWWMWAPSAREIAETYAEVEVVADPASRGLDGLDEVRIDDPGQDPALTSFRARRAAQRGHPAFGALAGRERVWLRRREEDAGPEDPSYLLELGPDGRWLRQVEVAPDGTSVRSTSDDWPINPPCDLYDPELAESAIPAETFEEAWRRARPESDGETGDGAAASP